VLCIRLLTVVCNFPHADGNHGGMVFIFVCLSVFPHDVSKNDAAWISKRHRHVQQWVLENHLLSRQKVKIKVTCGVGLCTLVSADFSCQKVQQPEVTR